MNNEYLEIAKIAAKEAGEILKEYYGKFLHITRKEDDSIVTGADLASDSIIRNIIKEKYPNHSFLSEESGKEEILSDYKWIIDPLDGTTNFTILNPFFAVSIGLVFRDTPLIGVVYFPLQKEIFYAIKGKGAFLEHQVLQVNSEASLSSSFITYCNGRDLNSRKKIIELYSELKLRNNHVRQIGAAALELAYVASGRTGAFLLPGVSAWDVIAGVLLVKESKGITTDFNGNPFSLESKTLLAAPPKLHSEILEIIMNLSN